jgi:hypothetical protein
MIFGLLLSLFKFKHMQLYVQVPENTGQPVLMENLYIKQCFQIQTKNET